MNEYGDVLEYFTAIKYECFTHTKELKKIKGGFLIKSIFDQLKNRSLNISTPKNMLIDFTHGHSIVNILNTLNVYEVNLDNYHQRSIDFVNKQEIFDIFLFVFFSSFMCHHLRARCTSICTRMAAVNIM